MKDHMKIQTHPLACEENIIKGEHYRITVLTKSLVRLEYSPTGHFTDAAPQVVYGDKGRPHDPHGVFPVKL